MEPGPGFQTPSLVLRISSCSSAPEREDSENNWRETSLRRPLGALIVTASTLTEVCLYALTLRRVESPMAHHCISHVKDVDGLSSAALVLAAKGGTFTLTDYDDLLKEIDAVPASATGVTICDLGTNASNFGEFIERLAGL